MWRVVDGPEGPDFIDSDRMPLPLRPPTVMQILRIGYLGSFMRAFLMFESFSPMEGYTAMSGFTTEEALSRGLHFQHECEDTLGNFSVASQNMKVDGLLKFPPHNRTI